jgi:deoxycytidylate deaminase
MLDDNGVVTCDCCGRQIVKENIQEVYGIEGMEDHIKNIYKDMPEMKERFLSEYYRIVWRKK